MNDFMKKLLNTTPLGVTPFVGSGAPRRGRFMALAAAGLLVAAAPACDGSAPVDGVGTGTMAAGVTAEGEAATGDPSTEALDPSVAQASPSADPTAVMESVKVEEAEDGSWRLEEKVGADGSKRFDFQFGKALGGGAADPNDPAAAQVQTALDQLAGQLSGSLHVDPNGQGTVQFDPGNVQIGGPKGLSFQWGGTGGPALDPAKKAELDAQAEAFHKRMQEELAKAFDHANAQPGGVQFDFGGAFGGQGQPGQPGAGGQPSGAGQPGTLSFRFGTAGAGAPAPGAVAGQAAQIHKDIRARIEAARVEHQTHIAEMQARAEELKRQLLANGGATHHFDIGDKGEGHGQVTFGTTDDGKKGLTAKGQFGGDGPDGEPNGQFKFDVTITGLDGELGDVQGMDALKKKLEEGIQFGTPPAGGAAAPGLPGALDTVPAAPASAAAPARSPADAARIAQLEAELARLQQDLAAAMQRQQGFTTLPERRALRGGKAAPVAAGLAVDEGTLAELEDVADLYLSLGAEMDLLAARELVEPACHDVALSRLSAITAVGEPVEVSDLGLEVTAFDVESGVAAIDYALRGQTRMDGLDGADGVTDLEARSAARVPMPVSVAGQLTLVRQGEGWWVSCPEALEGR